MAIVPQEVILFSGSILENIRFGLTSAKEEQIIEAAKKQMLGNLFQPFQRVY